MRRLREKIHKHSWRHKRDDEVPWRRPDNNPSLEPSARIASTNLITASPSQVRSLNDPSRSTTPSTHPIQNDSDNNIQQTTGEGADNRKKDCWQLAIEKLIQEDPSFSNAITSLKQTAGEDGHDFTKQLLKSTEEARQRVISRRCEFKFGDKIIVPRDQLGKVVAVIDSFKYFGSFDIVFAGLPWLGFCVLLQVATSDIKQYMDMVTGAQEVASIILRSKLNERLYMSCVETDSREVFATRFISLYMNIIRYQIAVASYCRKSTMSRFFRAIPNLDDVSDIIAAIKQEDEECKAIAATSHFQYSSRNEQEILTRLDRVEAKLPETHSISGDAPWIVPRPANTLFMGRSDILRKIEEAIRRSLDDSDRCEPCRIVITGMGGQGKSEICLQIANKLRNLFQGVFWIDVSTNTSAEEGFIDIAKAIHCDAKNLKEARQALSSVRKPWLLVLDNGDDPSFDYQAYLPTGTYGVVLMTSRNSECSRYATVLRDDMTLEGLEDDAARALLLKAANISPNECTLYEDDAQAICVLLESHPLALIQAGSYVALGYCTLHEYPERFDRRRKKLLEFSPKQAKSRYGHVYATFEASAEVLESSSAESARDALEILSMLSMIGYSPLPLAIFKATWEEARKIKQNPSKTQEIDTVSEQHIKELISLIDVNANEWDPDQLTNAINCLKSLSLITTDEKNGYIRSISIHPLIHAWAKERQTIKRQYQLWITTGSIFAVACHNNILNVRYERQLKPHLQAYLHDKVSDMLNRGQRRIVIPIIMNCAWLLNTMWEASILPSLLEDLFKAMNLDNKTVTKKWETLYHLYGVNLTERGKIKEGISLLEEVVKIREKTLAPERSNRLASQHELAIAYLDNGQTKEAISLLEEVVKIKEKTEDPEDQNRLASQEVLATAYLDNGQTKEAISLLEEVVKIREKILAPENPYRLASRHNLGRAYLDNGQTKEAISVLEEVVKIREKIQAPENPYRLASRHNLGRAYLDNGQTKEAISILEEVVKIEEKTLAPEDPYRLASRHKLASAYLDNGQTNEAISLLEEVVKIREKIQAPENRYRLASQQVLASAYLDNGQIMEAISLLEEVVKIREKTLAPEHPSRLLSEHLLATALLGFEKNSTSSRSKSTTQTPN